MPKVTMIKPNRPNIEIMQVSKLRVGAYCRVSSNHEEQQQSFTAQVDYYTNLIGENSEWQFTGIYADEGISGTCKSKRTEFLRLMRDCEARKLDMVITKSISRFARNTQDCIEAIRKLKEVNIAIYFEKENINTLEIDNELLITILGSTAQEESISISKNNKWAVQKRFKNGDWTPSYLPYGYTKDGNGEIIIDETEAVIVRRIFAEYLNGKGTYLIAKGLTVDAIHTRKGAKVWSDGVVTEILLNEKYVGDLMMQKTFTTSVLPFIRKRNTGQMHKYFIQDNHEPIISREQAERVLEIMKQRKKEKGNDDTGKYQNRYPFSSRIICGECGSTFKRQKLFTGKPYQTEQWCCNLHIRHKESCGMKAVREETIKRAFIHMHNKLKTNRELILIPLLEELKLLRFRSGYQSQIKELNQQIAECMEQSHVLSRLRSKGYIDSVLFIEQRNALEQKSAQLKEQRLRIMDDLDYDSEIEKTTEILRFFEKSDDLLDDFEEDTFYSLVEKITVRSQTEIIFCLINGLQLTEYLGKELE